MTIKDLHDKGLSGKLPEELYWVNRNQQGLYESGYVYTKEQVIEDLLFSDEDLKMLDENERVDGAFWGDDTYIVERVETYEELFNLMTWAGYDIENTWATGDLDQIEYPDFVDEQFQLVSNYVYEITGYTASYMAGSGSENPTFTKYVELMGIPADELQYNPTDEEIVRFNVAQALHDNPCLEVIDYLNIVRTSEVSFPTLPNGICFISTNLDGKEVGWVFKNKDALKEAWEVGIEVPANDDKINWLSIDGREKELVGDWTFEDLAKHLGIEAPMDL